MEEGDQEWVFEGEEHEEYSSGDENGWRFLNQWADALMATAPEKEEENTPFLNKEEIERLTKHPHVFDYTFSEEEKVVTLSLYKILFFLSFFPFSFFIAFFSLVDSFAFCLFSESPPSLFFLVIYLLFISFNRVALLIKEWLFGCKECSTKRNLHPHG